MNMMTMIKNLNCVAYKRRKPHSLMLLHLIHGISLDVNVNVLHLLIEVVIET